MNETYFWRKPLIPVNRYSQINAAPVHPTPISMDDIEVNGISSSPVTGEINFTVSWMPPTYINGDLQLYEICVGQTPVASTEDCPRELQRWRFTSENLIRNVSVQTTSQVALQVTICFL